MSDQNKEDNKSPESTQEIDSAGSVAISIEEDTKKLLRISDETVLDGSALADNTEVKKEDTMICIQEEIQAKSLFTSVAIGFQCGEKQDKEVLEWKTVKPPPVLFGKRIFWVFQSQQQGISSSSARGRRKGNAEDDDDVSMGPHVGKYGHTPAGNAPLEYEMRDPEERNSFVRLVFLITFIMLLVTFSFMVFCYNSPYMNSIMYSLESFILYGLSIVTLFCINYIFCCSNCAKKCPCNWLLITLAGTDAKISQNSHGKLSLTQTNLQTISYSWIVSFTAVKFAPNIVLGALGTTMAVVLACLGLACTEFDFTKCLLLVIVASLSVLAALCMGAVMSEAFGIPMDTFKLSVLCISAFLSSLMLIIELQMILGGKTVELGEKEYAYGAFLLYTAIIDLFIKFLHILNKIIGNPLPI